MPPSHKKIYIPLSLVHLIYTTGDKCMRQNACYQYFFPHQKHIFLKGARYSNFDQIFDPQGILKVIWHFLSLRDRVISAKFLTHRLYTDLSAIFNQKLFSRKFWAVILNFCVKCEKSNYLQNSAKKILKKFSTRRVFTVI